MTNIMSMVERVARAIAWAGKSQHDASCDANEFWDNTCDESCDRYLRQAKAAIEEMMVLTPEIVAAYWRGMPLSIYIDEQDEQAAKQHISSMFEAALEEKE